MSKRRQQMHGKTFGGGQWGRRPENHNMLAADRKRIDAYQRLLRPMSRAAMRAAVAMRNLGGSIPGFDRRAL